MCLILLSWRQRPDTPLLLAANRDEFYARPTAPATFWPEAPQLLAGRDLVGGGTWLGVATDGRWGAVTNYRDPAEHRPGAPSRGDLVRDYLLGGASPRRWLQQMAAGADRYPGFNLLLGSADELCYFSNRQGVIRSLPPGLYG
ncbi:MAG: NRDE family protein, partial [Desulfuromonadales bacterium]|nr:NRDE family protein [Desulfuromonadales bacterium]